MKNNIYSLIRSFFVLLLFFLLLPFLSFAQSLAPIPEVGPGVCVAGCESTTPSTFPNPTPLPDTDIASLDFPVSCPNDCSNNGTCNDGICNCFIDWIGTDCSTLSLLAMPVINTHLDNANELNKQAVQELNEGKYVEASTSINNTIESLNNAKDSLKTDPIILELCEGKPKAINKIERKIQSSINNYLKASLIVTRIIEITEEESLLQKLLKAANRLLTRRMPRPTTTNAVCGVRG